MNSVLNFVWNELIPTVLFGGKEGTPIWKQYILGFLTFFIGGCFYYFLFAGLSYYYFFVKYKDYYAPEFDKNQFELKREMKACVSNIFGEALLVSALKILVFKYSMTYTNFFDYSIPYFIFSMILFTIWTETWTYWIHRWLHTYDFLYRHLHYIHHSFVATSPFAGFAFHPVDSFMQALPTYTASFFFPVWWGTTMFQVVLISIWSVSIHDHVPLLPCKFFLYAPHHTIHHDEGRMKNYGLITSFWDRIMGTYEDPDHIYFGYKNAINKPEKIYTFKTGKNAGDLKLKKERESKKQK